MYYMKEEKSNIWRGKKSVRLRMHTLFIMIFLFCMLVGCGQNRAMKECPYCRKDVDEDAKFCPNCGKALTAGNDKAEDDTTSGDASIETDLEQGYDSEDELILAFIGCLNKETDFEDFYRGFDRTGYLAYWLTEYSKLSLHEAYDIFTDSDKGDTYLRDKYPEFYDARIRPATVEELTQPTSEASGRVKAKFSKFVEELAEKYGPYRNEIVNDDKWASKVGYSEYSISVDDPENYIQSIGITYICRDGKYYWVMIHQTA